VTPQGAAATKATGRNFPMLAIFEPTITADGKLLVARANHTLLNIDGADEPTNIIYVKNDGAACSVNGFRYADVGGPPASIARRGLTSIPRSTARVNSPISRCETPRDGPSPRGARLGTHYLDEWVYPF
jgi:hypothetical protein